MELFIIRHAQATYQSIDDTDKGRILADEGLVQAVKVGKYLKLMGMHPDLILTSPYRRTIETAHLISEYGDIATVQTEEWLASGMSPDTAITELSAYKSFNSVVVIGHQPDLGYLIEKLDATQSEVEVPVASVHHFVGDLKEDGGDIHRHKFI